MREESQVRIYVRGVYDIQKLRISMGNRITVNFKKKLGIDLKKKERESAKDDKKVLDDIRADYKRITDGIVNLPTVAKFKAAGVISTYAELCLVHGYMQLLKQEKQMFHGLEKILEDYPIWTEYLINVTGCGPAMAGVILSEFDIHLAKYPSSLHAYAGLDVGKDGRGRSRRKEHLIDIEYKDKDGKMQTRKGITFNPFLKTKLMGVLATSFLRCGANSPYSKIYYDYKHRLENHKKYKDVSKKHRHYMSMRYMIKMFLIDLYVAWRKLESLPVHEPYHVAKLGYQHGVDKAA